MDDPLRADGPASAAAEGNSVSAFPTNITDLSAGKFENAPLAMLLMPLLGISSTMDVEGQELQLTRTPFVTVQVVQGIS